MPRLDGELGLLPFDPAHARHNGQTHSLIANTDRSSNPDASMGRIHTKMKVLNRLTDYFNVDPANRDLMPFNIHVDFELVRRSCRSVQDLQ